MQKVLISTLMLVSSLGVKADDQQKINDRLNDNRLQSEPHFESSSPESTSKTSSSEKAPKARTLRLTREELAKQPELLQRAIHSALLQGNADNIALLLPIYQSLPQTEQHPIPLKWSQAILANAENDSRRSIKLYRELLAEYADLAVARLQLAIVLFANNELEAAEDQFQKLRSEPMDAEVSQLIDHYLKAIARQDFWTFNGGLTYLNDPNINNAPKNGTTYGNWHAPKRESAEGVGFNFNVRKKWSWGNGFYNGLRFNTSGKYYWDNRKYNELSTQASIGIGFQNAKTGIALFPFIEQTFYAGATNQSESLKRFSKSTGASIEWHYWLSPKWQLNSQYEYAEQRYITRKHLNGNLHSMTLGALYLAGAQRHFFAQLNYSRISTRDQDDRYFRRGITLGWQQEWQGFSSRLSLNLAQKRYKGPMPIFGITQRNREYGAQLSVWHRAVHYWGITPRLTYSFNKTQSNHVFYSYDKHRLFLDLSKSF